MSDARRFEPTYADVRAAAEAVLRRAETLAASDEDGLRWPDDHWGSAFATARLFARPSAAQAERLAAFGMENLVARRALLANEDALGRARCRLLAATVAALHAQGRPGAATALVALVGEMSGDDGMTAFLPLLVSLEALMACNLAASMGPAGQRQVRLYWKLALAEARAQSLAPALVLCAGTTGSGKSFVARGIAGALGARVFVADRERKRLLGLPPTERTPADRRDMAYSVAVSDRVYGLLLDRAHEELAAGRSAVLDATFLTRARRKPALELAQRLGVPALVLWCTLDDSLARTRLEERATQPWTISDGDAAVREAQAAGAELPASPEVGARVLSVDTAVPPAALFRTLLPRVLRELRAAHAGRQS